MKTVAFCTLGCKVNQYETNAMEQQFIKAGYNILQFNEKSDIYIINTCTVTNMSDKKSRQMLRKAKQLNEKSIVVAVGCYAQVAKDILEEIDEIDLILGNNEKKNIVKYVEEYNKNKITHLEDVMHQDEFVDFGTTVHMDKTRAVIKVQDGCDRFCSYCIIPYARGRVRSRKIKSVVDEVKSLAQNEVKEIVITGIHIASYGKDFKDGTTLIDLLEELNKIEGIERIRLGSIEPTIINDEFLNRLTKLNKICHHFHLSLQSGCDETLKRMNRRYTTAEFTEIVERLRKYYNDVILTTDIIVGFPQESEEEFQKTYEFLKKVKFYKMHVFKYSPRKGTKAEIMKGQIDGNKKEERSQKLIELSDENEKKYNESFVGKEVDILFEEEKNGQFRGHTKNYILGVLENNEQHENIENRIVKVKCVGAEKDHILVKM